MTYQITCQEHSRWRRHFLFSFVFFFCENSYHCWVRNRQWKTMNITADYPTKVSSEPTVISCFGVVLYNQNFISQLPTFHCSYTTLHRCWYCYSGHRRLVHQCFNCRATLLPLSTATVPSAALENHHRTAAAIEHCRPHPWCCPWAPPPCTTPSSSTTALLQLSTIIVLAATLKHHHCCHHRATPSSLTFVCAYFRGVS